MRADDLMAAVLPKLVGCQENQTGPIEIPDHPIVRQTVYDCMHEAMDIDGLKEVLDRIEAGEIRLHAKDTTEPSPFAHEMLNSKPYTYLDDAPLEERRTQAVQTRRATDPASAGDLGALDPEVEADRVVDQVVAGLDPDVDVGRVVAEARRHPVAPSWQPRRRLESDRAGNNGPDCSLCLTKNPLGALSADLRPLLAEVAEKELHIPVDNVSIPR